MSSSETLDEEFYDVPESEDVSSPRQPLFDRNQLEKFGHWLLEIPRDDVTALRETPEYADFLEAFEKLGLAHRRVMGTGYNHTNMSDQESTNKPSSFSFLQHMAVDDVVLRVMEFLECVTLIQTSATCSRFWDLARKSAIQRTHQIGMERQLQNVFELLRAKEQVEGLSEGTTRSYVPVPMLGLPRRVVVTDAGDPEYNGVYCCTDFDGNGFVFTKPRGAPPVSSSLSVNPLTLEELEQPIGQLPPPRTYKTRADKVLRCFISKKFSNETILWYMSKEVETITSEGEAEISQYFTFWAKLMHLNETTSVELCGYPSQTSILSHSGDPAWQPLTQLLHPPTVELLD